MANVRSAEKKRGGVRARQRDIINDVPKPGENVSASHFFVKVRFDSR